MAATELKNGTAAVEETKTQEFSNKVVQQVSEILEEASQRQPVRPALIYRVPSPGVRYYF